MDSLITLTEEWVNGRINNPYQMVNEVRLVTLSKTGERIPQAKGIRPIAI